MTLSKLSARAPARAAVIVAAWAMALASSISPVLMARPMKPLEVKRGYREVLELLATGDEAVALAELILLEQSAVGDQQAWRYVDNLWRSKLQVIRDLLVEGSVELLRPIITLHHDAYFEYSQTGRRYLAQHSRTMSGELAEIYAEKAATPRAASFAGWVMTSFAAYLWSPSNISESADLFFRAHELDPGNPLALEGLAAAYERGANYQAAVESLEKALSLEPGNPELLLRLALCRMRAGQGETDSASQQLDLLTGPSTPDWIRSVAFQELARARLEDNQVELAETTLREALRGLPGDQQLSLQLASLLDGQRLRSEALGVLDAIRISGWEQDSPRQRYDFWAPPDMAIVRDELHEEAESGVSSLAASLGKGAGS